MQAVARVNHKKLVSESGSVAIECRDYTQKASRNREQIQVKHNQSRDYADYDTIAEECEKYGLRLWRVK